LEKWFGGEVEGDVGERAVSKLRRGKSGEVGKGRERRKMEGVGEGIVEFGGGGGGRSVVLKKSREKSANWSALGAGGGWLGSGWSGAVEGGGTPCEDEKASYVSPGRGGRGGRGVRNTPHGVCRKNHTVSIIIITFTW
jgi:hypothetical protein